MKIEEFILDVENISKNAFKNSSCPYAKDNFEELTQECKYIKEELKDLTYNPYKINKDIYYSTPQPGVRILVVKNNKVLMTQDKDSPKHLWTLPGGWCDIDISPVVTAKKEMFEETGYKVKIIKLLALIDRNIYEKKTIDNVYNIVFLAEIIGGKNNPNFEVSEVKFFDIDNLPEFSNKLSRQEFDIILKAYKTNTTYFE